MVKKIIRGIFRSKTFGLAAVLGVATWLQNHFGILEAIVPAAWLDASGYAIALAIAVLRVVTNKPLEDK